jgi:hypothetical protein
MPQLFEHNSYVRSQIMGMLEEYISIRKGTKNRNGTIQHMDNIKLEELHVTQPNPD